MRIYHHLVYFNFIDLYSGINWQQLLDIVLKSDCFRASLGWLEGPWLRMQARVRSQPSRPMLGSRRPARGTVHALERWSGARPGGQEPVAEGLRPAEAVERSARAESLGPRQEPRVGESYRSWLPG